MDKTEVNLNNSVLNRTWAVRRIGSFAETLVFDLDLKPKQSSKCCLQFQYHG